MDKSAQLGTEKIPKLLWKFSIPAIIGMLVNAIYNVIDRIFIGHGVGSLGIAGVTVGFPFMLVIMAFAMLIAIGATSLISIKLGEQNKEEAELILGNGIVLLILISLVMTVIGTISLTPLLRLFGASDVVLPYARDYMRIIIFGTVLMSTGFGMSNFIRAEGNPKFSMYTMLLGAILNIILNPIFIFVLGWGVAGAAIATVLARTVATCWILYYYLTGKSILRVSLANFKLRLPIIKKIIVIGMAPFAMQLSNSLLQVIMNKSLGYYGGDIAIAGMGVTMSIATLMFMPIIGITQGAQPIIGYNYGAKQYDRLKETLKLAIFAATAIATIGSVAIQLFPGQFIGLFNSEDKQLLEFGTHTLRIFLMAFPIVGFQIVGANYFQAVGKPRQAMFLSLSRQVLVLIPLLLIMPRFLGLNGILYSGPISDLISSVLVAIWLGKEIRNLNEHHKAATASQLD